LRTCLFDIFSGWNLVEEYAQKLAEIVQELEDEFQGVSLHRRVAFLLPPDKEFIAELRTELSRELNNIDSTKYELVTAGTYAKMVGSGETHTQQQLVMDSIDNFDGLECLIAVGVHLDEPVSADTRPRSRIYRAITRAQMLLFVVNENVEGGWLEFAQHIYPKTLDHFNRQSERAAIAHAGQRKVRMCLCFLATERPSPPKSPKSSFVSSLIFVIFVPKIASGPPIDATPKSAAQTSSPIIEV
jgi:hypothetical protein